MLNTFSSFVFFLLLFSSDINAQLIPISEGELSTMTGQAFINLDRSSSGGLDFTKVSLGLDVKTSLNSDLLELGRYERSGEVAGSSDIRISDFALGKIDEGGNIVPFEIKDPFIELAFENNAGKQDLVGVRLGFGGAKGALSGVIESLTGNINVDIVDTAQALGEADGDFIGDVLAALGPSLLGNSPIVTRAQLVNTSGNPDNIRSTTVGVPNGSEFSIDASSVNWFTRTFVLSPTFGLLPDASCSNGCRDITLISNNCYLVGGIGTCFNLSDYNTLEVGNKLNDGTFDFAEGLFLSFQTKDVTWKDGSTSTTAASGAFLNVPNGGLEVTLKEALNGTDRVRTKYVDPYFGGF
jgi:hypothetical protein